MERSRTKTETVRTIVQHDNVFKFQQSVGKGGSGESGGKVEKWPRWTSKVEKWKAELEQKLDNDTLQGCNIVPL